MYKYSDELTECGLFSGFKREQIWDFLSRYSYKISEYKSREAVEIYNGKIAFVIKGSVKIYYINNDGTASQTNIKSPITDYILYDDSLYDAFNVRFEAITDSTVLYVEAKLTREFNKSTPLLQNIIMKNMLSSYNFCTKKQHIIDSFYVQKTVRSKLLKFNEYQNNPPAGFEVFHLTKKELADLLKVDYSSLCREYNKLAAEGVQLNIFFDKEH